MKRLGYKQFIENHVCQLPYNSPIYTADIAVLLAAYFDIEINQAKSLVNVNLLRIAEACDLVRYQKGIYYRAQNTGFGKSKLNPAIIHRDRYVVRNGKINGYETGAAFLNRLGLSTQIPKYKKFATNAFRQRGSRTDKKLQVILTKPKAEITNENYSYLQLLDAIENKDNIPIDAENPNKVFHRYMVEKGIELHKLVDYAEKYYNKNIQPKILQIIIAG